MRSYQIADYAAPLALAEGAAPTPTGTEVLLRIHACGVCHSDVHLWEGYFYLGGGRRIVSPPPEPNHQLSAARQRAPMSWMQRLRRVFDIYISQCRRCGAALRVLAVITEPRVTAAILEHFDTRAARWRSWRASSTNCAGRGRRCSSSCAPIRFSVASR